MQLKSKVYLFAKVDLLNSAKVSKVIGCTIEASTPQPGLNELKVYIERIELCESSESSELYRFVRQYYKGKITKKNYYINYLKILQLLCNYP